jgi:hypothetical protein
MINHKSIRRMSSLLAIVFAIPSIMLSSCDYSYLDGIEDIKDYTYSPVFALPLVSSSISMNDIMDVGDLSFIELDADKLITLVYKGQIFSVDAKNIFTLKDQYQEISFTGITPAGSGNTTLPPKEFVFLLSFESNEIITWVSFLDGLFNVTAQADMLVQDGYSLNASFRILNSFKANGQPIGGNVSLNQPASIGLAGSRIELGNEANFILVEYTLTISGNGTPTNAPYTVNFMQSFTNLRYDLLQGYIDMIDFPIGNAVIPISIFKNTSMGSVEFVSPRIDITFNNSFGLPIDINILDFSGTTADNRTINITGAATANPWRVGYAATPAIAADTSGVFVDKTNSNLFEITSQAPKDIYLNVRGLTNPDATISTKNWLKHNSNLNIDVEIRLPLHGQINYFNIQDTVKLAIDSIPDELEWIELKMIVSNGFPISTTLKILMIDDAGSVIDTLFKKHPKLMEAAPVNPSTGIAGTPAITTIIEMIDGVTAENFKKASNLIIDATLESYNHQNNTPVKILDNYRLGIDIGLRAKGKKVIEL